MPVQPSKLTPGQTIWWLNPQVALIAQRAIPCQVLEYHSMRNVEVDIPGTGTQVLPEQQFYESRIEAYRAIHSTLTYHMEILTAPYMAALARLNTEIDYEKAVASYQMAMTRLLEVIHAKCGNPCSCNTHPAVAAARRLLDQP